jgi:YfiR/HmsC-like
VAFLSVFTHTENSGNERTAAKLSRAVFFVLLAVLLAIAPASLAEDGAPSEYQVKAAFLYNFVKFVKWPDSAFSTSNAPITIGILGDNPFGSDLQVAVRNKTVNGHPLAIRQISSAEMNQCHVVFVARSPKRNLVDVLAALKGTDVLTVSEVDRFIESGGMINFLTESNKVRFEINDGAAKAAGLTISSKLLNLAKKPEGGK